MTRRASTSPNRRPKRSPTPTPTAQGFRMPAEWEPHRVTWLVWPHNPADWEVKTAAIDWCYVEIIRHLVDGEGVALVCQHAAIEQRARRRLRQGGVDPAAIEWHCIPTNRSWIRDVGPIFVVRPAGRRGRRKMALTDWGFNGWARYRAWQRDNAIPAELARRLGMQRFKVVLGAGGRRAVVLEGGSIDVNGEGLLLTTEECLLSPIQARNPGMTQAEIEHVMCDYLGVRKVLWLAGGIAGDDTHGHVDDVARFVSTDTVVAAEEPDPHNIDHVPLAENLARLRAMRDLNGQSLRIVPLPMPRPLYFEGNRLPASYLNFYIANHCVLVPTFNDPQDRVALSRLAKLFPGREVVGIHSGDLVLGLGTIHCLTQQEPLSDV